jgi:molecular chaperone DnaK (HSP70)
MGQLAMIGRPALELNEGAPKPSYVPSFKRQLLREALRPVARVDGKSFSARDTARIFARELFAEIKEETGERVRDLVVTTPVDSFESYRAEVMRIVRRLGVKRIRFIDEPVAAAIGYGLNTAKERLALVVDFGGGTLDFALVALTPKDIDAGSCRVLAKEARPIGGNLVDKWLLKAFCDRLDQPMMVDDDDESAFWHRLMLAEACRVKESVFFNETETFYLIRPDELGNFEARVRGTENHVEITKQDVVDVLEERGLYRMFDECVQGIFQQVEDRGIKEADLDDILMVGGSTLLPNIYPLFEKRFGRDKVRAWQPFEAVAYGACAFAAESYTQSDFIVHDYAFVTYNAKSHEKEYTTVVPRGTRFPTPPAFWKRQLVPTCSLGEPETMFKLVICEIGTDSSDERKFQWDASGGLHKVGGKDGGKGGPLIVPLNESNPTLGYLKPAHPPSDRRPRLEIEFGVNEDRWLSATVSDLRTKKTLMKDEPVVRLL